MKNKRELTPDTIRVVADQLLDFPMSEADRVAVAGLLNALSQDMAPMHLLDVEHEEPALIYQAIASDDANE